LETIQGLNRMPDTPTIAIIGGTGDLGSGLARLWARAGYPIVIGSRDKGKAEATARELCAGGGCVRGDENTAAARAADIVVVSAFHNVGAKKLHGAERADCDVLVFSDDTEARARVVDLAGLVATRGVDGGSLANSVAAEALTSVLIAINRKYKVPGAGIRITGLPCAGEGDA
jgi:predicted dinucleotide-binding enzyme